MQAYSQPLIKLHMEATRFLRERSLRLLHVVADATLHDAAMEILAAMEYRAENRSPFVILKEPHRRSSPGWERRALTVRRQHEQRRTAMAERGERLGELPEPPTSKGLVGLGEQLGQLLHARPDDTEGLVVLLSPSFVEAPEAWQQALGVLLSLQGLAAVRFVIIDRERSSLGGLVSRHGERAHAVTCRVEGESPKAVLAAALDEDILSFGGPVGARPKGVIPPRRLHDPPLRPPDPEAVRQLAVTRSVLEASVAVEEGRMSDAIVLQARARDGSMEAGRIEQGVMMELVLGGYLLTAGAVTQAEESYVRASTTAEAAGLLDKAAMARLALGSSRLVRNDRTGALVEFAQASTMAERAGNDALALHACRLTGDTARELRMDAQAIAFWAKAIEIAERDPATAPLTSAGLVALQLAVLCRERGQQAEAEAFLNKADALVRVDPERLQREDEVGTALPPVIEDAPARSLPTNEVESTSVAEHVESAFEGPTHEPAPMEGTTQLAWDDIAALHGDAPPPTGDEAPHTEHVHRWSPDETDTLRLTTTAVLGRESTVLLSLVELSALRGELDLPPAHVAAVVERTERIDPAEIRRFHGKPDMAAEPSSPTPPAPVVPAAPSPGVPVVSGDGTELYTKDMIRALRAAWTKRNPGDDSTPGGEGR
jgi:tetratricopeptide (TPR) repeat protein